VALKQQLSLVRFPQFEIIIKGVNKFKNRQVIYCLNADDSDELNKLARDILHKGQNIFPELKYRFSPHITIARSKRDVPFDFIGEQIKMQVRQFTLFESKGGVYYPLSEYSSVRS
jgi:2'-5' RNA ligase